ncbi:unnamed protein product [Adineta steineri]|uniref:Uncharacterized protein n=1 Tax=Adineta steineri TaxID=433720 RepID=A0A818XRW8_9BILA|nr:unnamed protein product [Adineta steineri]
MTDENQTIKALITSNKPRKSSSKTNSEPNIRNGSYRQRGHNESKQIKGPINIVIISFISVNGKDYTNIKAVFVGLRSIYNLIQSTMASSSFISGNFGDIKGFLYAWLGKQNKLPSYEVSQQGTQQRIRFKCEVSLNIFCSF